MNRAPLVACVILLAAGLAAAGALLLSPSKCAPPSDSDRAQLVSAVRLKYNLPSNADVGVADAGPVPGSCFRRLIFGNLSGKYFHAELFVSPDFRFLSKDLFDARPNPREEARRRRRVADELAGPTAPTRTGGRATVTLAVFSDFQCPFCARLATALDGMPSAEMDKLQIVYHYFPLSGHQWARSAAEAAACAQRQNVAAFWSLHDYLFAHQKELSLGVLSSRISDWATTTSGLDPEQFRICVSRSLTSGQVDQDVALGTELGVGATPTVFVDGEPVEDTSPEGLRAAVERASATRQVRTASARP